MELILMLFLHLIDDYKLQGILADFKQKRWWEKHTPDKKYKDDYLVALFEHSFMNSVMIHIPIYLFICKDMSVIIYTLALATIVHAFTDHLKANELKINLLQDQLIHIITIVILYIGYKLLTFFM